MDEHEDGPDTPTVFRFEAPVLAGRAKKVTMLARTQAALCTAQTVGQEGANNLHSHPFYDGFWIVIRGGARFHTAGGEVVAELQPLDGVVIPRGFPYWFERTGEQDLEILQFEARYPRAEGDTRPNRIDHAAMTPTQMATYARESGNLQGL